MRLHKELQPLARRAKDNGWRIEQCNGGHIRFVSPAGKPIITAATPSDLRTVPNLKAQLHREGLPRDRPEKDRASITCRCGATAGLTFLIRGYGRGRRQAWLTRPSCPKHVGRTKRDMDKDGGCNATDWYEEATYDAAHDAIDALRGSNG